MEALNVPYIYNCLTMFGEWMHGGKVVTMFDGAVYTPPSFAGPLPVLVLISVLSKNLCVCVGGNARH